LDVRLGRVSAWQPRLVRWVMGSALVRHVVARRPDGDAPFTPFVCLSDL
jgi:hypothetical protein